MSFIGSGSVMDATQLFESEVENRFKALYESQKKAVWFPEEINVQQDMHDWMALSEKEKEVFKNLIGYFVGTELLVQNVLGDTFYSYIKSPRAKMALSVQMFMEAIHNDFFEMILNSFSLDRDEMYNRANNNPILLAKRELVSKAADSISTTGHVDPDTLEGKKAILHAVLINNIVQEGIFFYSSFAMFFSMRDMGKMSNICNGVDLVLIDESLHLKMGMEIIFTMIEQNPEILDDESFVAKIQDTIVNAVDLELQFLEQQYATGITFGINYKEMAEYLKYIADRRMEELGFGAYFGVQENPLKFLEKQDVMTLQNFFEVTPNQYTNS